MRLGLVLHVTRIDLPATAERLLERRRVTPEGCWEWTRSTRNGYGRIWIGRKQFTVHRLAAHIWLDFDLASSLMICHRCDNPPCFNPTHLFPGTAVDNMSDASRKGRLSGPRAPRETVYPRIRSCAACGQDYEPDSSHRGRSLVCSHDCRRAYLAATTKGRGAALTDAQMEAARAFIEAGWHYRQVGEMYGVSGSCIHRHLHGRKRAA